MLTRVERVHDQPLVLIVYEVLVLDQWVEEDEAEAARAHFQLLLGILVQEGFDLGLPELIRDELLLDVERLEVNDLHCELVDVDGLVTNYELLHTLVVRHYI